MNELYTFSGKLQRLPYLGRVLLTAVSQIVLVFISIMFFAEESVAAGMLLMIAAIALGIPQWAFATRRTRDTGANPWLVLILAIPYAGIAMGIFLLFAPTDSVG